MLRLGVIKWANGPWRSPIMLVPKPDGSIRFCICFRKVSKLAQFCADPMRRADILIESVGIAQYLSTLDLTKGYWQVPLRAQDKEKTTFTTPSGLNQFTVMLFGLHGAPATFQWLVDTLLGDCVVFSLVMTSLSSVPHGSNTFNT